MKKTSALEFFLVFIFSFFLLPVIVYFLENISYVLTDSNFAESVLFSPLIEEAGKIVLLFFLSRKVLAFGNSKKVENRAKLILLIGFAFGLAENVIYVLSAYSEYSYDIVLRRIFTAQVFHTFIPLNFVWLENKNFFLALLIPVLLHALWNGFIYFEVNFIFVYLFGLLLAIFSIYKLLRIK